MFIGQGFDFDNDGSNDVFVVGKVQPPDFRIAGLILLLTCAGIGVVFLAMASGEFWSKFFNVADWVVRIGAPPCAIAFLAKLTLRVPLWKSVAVLLPVFVLGDWALRSWTAQARREAKQKVTQAIAESENKQQVFDEKVKEMRDEILRKAREKAGVN